MTCDARKTVLCICVQRADYGVGTGGENGLRSWVWRVHGTGQHTRGTARWAWPLDADARNRAIETDRNKCNGPKRPSEIGKRATRWARSRPLSASASNSTSSALALKSKSLPVPKNQRVPRTARHGLANENVRNIDSDDTTRTTA